MKGDAWKNWDNVLDSLDFNQTIENVKERIQNIKQTMGDHFTLKNPMIKAKVNIKLNICFCHTK